MDVGRGHDHKVVLEVELAADKLEINERKRL